MWDGRRAATNGHLRLLEQTGLVRGEDQCGGVKEDTEDVGGIEAMEETEDMEDMEGTKGTEDMEDMEGM